ncbi:MAG: antibiotic biosynthesis monooxygenase [Thiotrichales bacterium]
MHVTLVHVRVKSEHIAEFIEATARNHAGSVSEPGCLRFDVLRAADDPHCFVLYEAYRTAAAAAAHKQTPHYAIWRDAVADWMAEPRHGIRYEGLYPDLI